jgi:hypothetical protein
MSRLKQLNHLQVDMLRKRSSEQEGAYHEGSSITAGDRESKFGILTTSSLPFPHMRTKIRVLV